ncbi:hypothetical protein [uncultured Alistipes sp.]|uniref:hypothetical protein n=1 Tax=uncultured Alistipes sp. TaxID=538949 RepID=UPI0026361F53|nr:hypothetical protein [uncultured Alistipes sp.]
MKTRIEVKSLDTGKVVSSHKENRRMTAKEIAKERRECLRYLDPAKFKTEVTLSTDGYDRAQIA